MQLEQLGKDGDIASILERMMGQLLSKDVLYEPLKEISQRVRGFVYPSLKRAPPLSSARRVRCPGLRPARLTSAFPGGAAPHAVPLMACRARRLSAR